MKISLLLFLACLVYINISAQKKNAAFEIHIQQTTAPVIIDGVGNEPAWQQAEVASNFFMVLPMDTSQARVRTDVQMAYDDKNMYLLATCYNALPGPDMVESLRRDFNFQKNDNFILFMDPFEDQTNGFAFGTNSAGAQWDGLLYDGGKADLSWDHKWTSNVKHYSDRWTLEIAIPFKTLRYKNGITRWGVNFSRNDLKTTEKSSWAPVPRQFPTASLAYTGVLVWDKAPAVQGPNISLIPYVLGGASKKYQPALPKEYRHEIGLDAKVSITSSLNLDLTVNPDFSQVEVDRQVTNLDRYELFFPEKRQFFLENGDQLNNFGYPSIRPFFSRRIGLGVPLEFGGKLSGKIDRNWRISVMGIQTSKVAEQYVPRQNFSVVALQRKVFSRSNFGILLINKQSLGISSLDSTWPKNSLYNRDIGFEYNLASANNIWTGKSVLLKSFSPGKKKNTLVQAGNLQYSSRYWTINGAYEYVGKNFSAEVGYVPRQGYIKINPQIAYNFFPKYGSVLSHGPQLSSSFFFNELFRGTDNASTLTYPVTFRSRSTLAPVLKHDYVQLLLPFDPTNTQKDSLVKGSRHQWNTIGVDYISKPQSLFTYGFSAYYGGYYANGEKLNFSTDIGYRFQPFVSLSLNTSYNKLWLPQPWGNTNFWLIGPKVDVTLTNTLFFTTYVQYNQQLKNTNVNARLQWRYKPASDLFIVYSDNYYISPFTVRSRALLLKFTYWWNI